MEELATDVVWALSYLSNEDEQHTELPISPCFLRKLMSKLIELLEINFKCKKPIIQIIGNAVSGSDSQTQIVLDSGFLNHLADLLGNSSTEVRKNSCGIIAMIACGNHDQIQQLMKRKKILHQLVVKATHDQWSVRKEALWAIVYILTNGSYTDISWMIGANGFDPLITFLALENSDVKLLVAVLDAVENAFKAHQKYLDLFAENRGIDYIEELQKHRSDVVYKKVVHLIDNFFGVEEDENSLPATNDSGHFTLGMTSVPTPKNLFPIKQNQGSPKESSSPFRHLFTNNRSSH
ncbi:unnamed protein product [Pseudo-nitzschia multistriata]|uniref:Armadillo repeat-containing domain-containing protein n=1 Tax=Pseudo-nitzschia multistriata TaxID=183589 RepID=A0A448Z2V4_9STRA|nr:unnamed protein product [Pseudo-nitzschia multistriata]